MRAIWATWHEGKPLEFTGKFYTHTLMTPTFVPPDRSAGRPRVFLAAVGERMTEVAGEVADGLICHGFTTEKYVREVTIPALERGLARAGRKREDVEVTVSGFTVGGATEEAFAAARTMTQRQIAFYGSTPAYRAVLELEGRAGLQDELNALSKRGEWEAMGDLIDDDLIGRFAVVGEPHELADGLANRYGGLVDRVMYSGQGLDAAGAQAALARLREA